MNKEKNQKKNFLMARWAVDASACADRFSFSHWKCQKGAELTFRALDLFRSKFDRMAHAMLGGPSSDRLFYGACLALYRSFRCPDKFHSRIACLQKGLPILGCR